MLAATDATTSNNNHHLSHTSLQVVLMRDLLQAPAHHQANLQVSRQSHHQSFQAQTRPCINTSSAVVVHRIVNAHYFTPQHRHNFNSGVLSNSQNNSNNCNTAWLDLPVNRFHSIRICNPTTIGSNFSQWSTLRKKQTLDKILTQRHYRN